MKRTFKEALKNRRTCYSISNQSTVSDKEIQEIIEFTVLNIPSSFNSQSTRIVLLLGENHKKLWTILKDTMRKLLSDDKSFEETKTKIDTCFAAGYGTVLFFEDQTVVDGMMKAFPLYADNFPIWSQHTNAMHQLAIWTMLEDTGLGASLQHYNSLIEETVANTWKLDKQWKLVAQMPFGLPLQEAGVKESKPLSERVKVF